MKTVKLALPLVPDAEIEASRTAMAIAEDMKMSPDRIDEVGHAVVEACINALEHSHSTEEIRVTFEVLGGQDPEKLRITVRDTGRGFDVDNPGKRQSDRPGGFGLKIIRGLMDELYIRSGPGGTTLVMSKLR